MPRAPAKKTVTRRRVYAKPQAKPVRRTVVRRSVAAPVRTASRRSGTGAMFRDAGTGLGTIAGGAFGGPGGAALGGAVGRLGGAMLSKLLGHGDYAVSNAPSVKENNLLTTNASNIPQFGTGRVAVNFRHREFLGDVFSAASANTFKIDDYPINPGLPTTFPWLSGVVGAKFQQYRINGMTFEFRSMSSDALNSTNTALGSVIMSTDYDSADVSFSTKQEMENTEYGVSCKPSVNMLHGIECARMQTPVTELYIRAFDVPSGKDIRLYDLGRFSIATTGCQGTNVNLGELWVTYDIDCFKAIEQVSGYLIPYAQYQLNSSAAAAPLGTSQTIYPVPGGADLIGLTLTENKVSWPIDIEIGSRWAVTLAYQANEAKAITQPVVSVGNGIKVNINTAWKVPTSAVATDQFLLHYDVEYQGGATPAALPYINFADFTWAVATIQQGDLYIAQLSGNFGGTYTGTSDPEFLLSRVLSDTSPEYVSVHEPEEKKTVQIVPSRRR